MRPQGLGQGRSPSVTMTAEGIMTERVMELDFELGEAAEVGGLRPGSEGHCRRPGLLEVGWDGGHYIPERIKDVCH